MELTLLVSSDWKILTGIVNQNLDPTFNSDSTPIAPFMSLTSCLEMESPRPVPPKRRVEELSACWKGTKSSSTSLGARPMPVSLHVLSFSSRTLLGNHVLDHKLQVDLIGRHHGARIRDRHRASNRTFLRKLDSVADEVHKD